MTYREQIQKRQEFNLEIAKKRDCSRYPKRMTPMQSMTDATAETVTLLFSQTATLWHAAGLKVWSAISSGNRFTNYGRAKRWKHIASTINLKNARSVSFFVSAAVAPLWHTVITVHFMLPIPNVGNKYESCCFDKTV